MWYILISSPTKLSHADLNIVILIDEADVFIEERNFADMKRNALISGLILS